jgi:type IV pilus assembly protein PilC
MATQQAAASKDALWAWTGKDKAGKQVSGEMRAPSETVVRSSLRRQGVNVSKVGKKSFKGGSTVTDKDVTLFTRQLSVMMKAGVPLLQSFDIVGRGHSNPAVGRLLLDIKADIETGSSMSAAFRKYPQYFDALFCNLIAAGEQAGILDTLLDRLATYKEKILAIKSKIKSALTYPLSIIIIALVITAAIMIFVIPAFKEVFASFGAELPAPTVIVMAMSDFVVTWWWALFGGLGAGVFSFITAYKRSRAMQIAFDRLSLKAPVFGQILTKSAIARWTRTLATMFSAGVPLVEALESVGGASGNYVFLIATKQIQNEVSTGTNLTTAMQNSNIFPSMVIQMVAIGEESGALDSMLSKVADFFEAEVDEAVEMLASLMEPMIMVILGGLIGGLIVAMYLPIFKLGAVVG